LFSTNVTADKVLAYDAVDEVLDTRRVYIAQAGGDVAAGLKEFASRPWAARRGAFEAVWADGERFVYGAVNGGGMGTESYGSFCLVADPTTVAPPILAVFPGDSAQRYTNAAGDVDQTQMLDEVTAWDDRADLSTIERHLEVDSRTDQWPVLLCSADRYIETVLAPGPATDQVDEVRLRSEYVVELDELQAQALASDDLTAVERSQVAAYDVIQSWRRNFGTAIEEVS
jgi:hypothetical protein